MVDFKKLRARTTKSRAVDPIEIFRRLPKPPGIHDLYTSQAEVLHAWFNRRSERDTVLKLHTGGGKTLVGLLIAQSTLNETNEPVLYLTPTVQLVNQTIEKAHAVGISAVSYEPGQALSDEFVNGNAIMVATYKALFNGKSKFGLRGASRCQNVSAIILDDAHAAFSVVRESFTLEVSSNKNLELYEDVTGLFRMAFKEIDKLGTFDDILAGSEYAVLEVPYWAWREQRDAVRELLKAEGDNFGMEWPLLRDNLHLCHALISRKSFSITPVLPLVDLFPTFFHAPRRVYMSATIADDSDIIRIFDANPASVQKPLTSRSLAGVSERMILIPDLMPCEFDLREAISKLLKWTSKTENLGSVILVSSDANADTWSDIALVARGSKEVEKYVADLQAKAITGPVVFANRYDGMDLADDSCRLLVMSGLPAGTSSYEMFRATALNGGTAITRMQAQRIEQGIGRGSRGSGDHCVILLTGSDLSAWISKTANFTFLTSTTRAQLEMGTEISKEIKDLKDLAQTIKLSYDRNKNWVEYHAERLAELVTDGNLDTLRFEQATIERKAINLWRDGYNEQAISKIEKFLSGNETLDQQTRGWMQQISARIADEWGHSELAEDLQREAYANNRNLVKPKVLPPYRPLPTPGPQSKAIVDQLGNYRQRGGFLKSFESVVSFLHHNSSANQFEEALKQFATMIGLVAERHDLNGEGPDVLWLLPDKTGFVIEAKSRKKDTNPLTKEEHGQLLVAAEWFKKHYPDYGCIRVSVHPRNQATKAAVAGASHALTYENLGALVSDARVLLTALCESNLSGDSLLNECNRLLSKSYLKFDHLVDRYLSPFESAE
ncbi:MAG: DEAD/DEAH box helicase [Limnochordia bacterium]|nr:DEAD/DEAH box helicase [Limnochordia bacterium]